MQDSSPLARVTQDVLLTSYLPRILTGSFWPSTFVFKGFLVLAKYLYSLIHIRIITSTIKDKSAWPTRALWTQKLGSSIQKPDRSSLLIGKCVVLLGLHLPAGKLLPVCQRHLVLETSKISSFRQSGKGYSFLCPGHADWKKPPNQISNGPKLSRKNLTMVLPKSGCFEPYVWV